MNLSRHLFAIPVLFAAAVTGAACSSSSSTTTVTSSSHTNSSTNSSTGDGCAALALCCPTLPSADISTCNGVVSGGVGCETELTSLEAQGACGTTMTSSSSTVTTGSSSTITTGSSSSKTGSSSSSSSGPPVGCTPHALSGFTASANFPPAATCTTAQTKATVLDCFELSDAATSDAGMAACDQALFTNGDVDAGFGSCGQCVITAATSTAWGAFVEVDPPQATGSTMTTPLDLFDTGGCLARADTSAAGQACAKALNELNACEFNSCVPYCPVANSQTDTAGVDALLGSATGGGCLSDADMSICASYVSAADTACATESTDAGTGPLDKCNTLISDAASSTGALPQAFENYIGIICGGFDAGI